MAMAERRGIIAVGLSVLLLALGVGASMLLAQAINTHALPSPAQPGEPVITAADMQLAWLARVLLVLSVAWVLIGILSARTSLVRRPGAAAARATWLAATRPWRARESTLGMLTLDRWLLFLVPVALLIATRAVQSSFVGWIRLLAVIGAWTVFALALRIVVRRRSPWPVMAAVGGVIVLRCVLTLIALSPAGPGGYWYAFWELRVARGAYLTVAFAVFCWLFLCAAWSLFAQLGPRRAVGATLCAIGAGIAVPAAYIGAVGLERALTVWDDRSGLMPWGLARILSITLRLRIPDDAVWWAAGIGLVILLAGASLAVRWAALRQLTARVGSDA
ncbi:hypothetical protein GCM10022240_15640 [Microbacterium kribbense]|uniref:Uncharacterized protein n=1 Tax=Microbacterium kribbense TaxID=433645 RepID=A0ABP7GGS0_9MICO